MGYRVHRVKIKEDTCQEELEKFLNGVSGEVVSVVPIIVPAFFMFGAASWTKMLLIVEKV